MAFPAMHFGSHGRDGHATCMSATTTPISTAVPATRGGAWFRRPVLAPLLRERKVAVALAAGGAIQLLMGCFHIHGIDCPVPEVFGVPCPGCGLTRACAALLGGSSEWVHIHAFAPAI